MPANSMLLYLLIPAAAVLGAVAVKFLDYLRRKEADSEARSILERAHLEIANRKKEAELEIKENTLQQRAQLEADMSKIRDELHERERGMNRKDEALGQRAEHLSKQERAVEGTQRRLTERMQETDRRGEELTKLLDIQRQTLHQLTGMSREEATSRLLSLLENELQQEAGSL
ncbi:MAG TPA: Rnase Y domain-containing protein, partial [Pirellulaceae bacterium]